MAPRSETRQSLMDAGSSSTSAQHLPISYTAADSAGEAAPNGHHHQPSWVTAAHVPSDDTVTSEPMSPTDGALSSVPELPGRPGAAPAAVMPMEISEALLPPRSPPKFVHPLSMGQRRWMVCMFCMVAALLSADQNLLAPNMTDAANYFGMDDKEKDWLLGGLLMAAFFAVGAPAALVVGWLTDKGDINRRNLLFWVVVIGETPCLLTYWVTEYWQFFILRALTGVAVGGCFPLVFSLLGDLFPPERRAAISAVVQIATGAGLAAGQALAGAIGPATNWRVPFVVVAAPSLLMALLMLVTTREPPRGAFEEALRETYAEGGAYTEAISWAKLHRLLRIPSNVLIISQGLPGSLPWGMVLTYLNDYLSQNKGLSVQAATLVLLMFGGGGAVGVIAGGSLGQWLYNRRKEYQALLAGSCVLAGIGPLYGLINANYDSMGLGAAAVLSFTGGAIASVAGPNLRSVMLNVNEPETRGVALALQSMTDDLGKGLGPVMVAGLIHVMGRKAAFNVATAFWAPCGVLLASLACCMRRDEAAMQRRLTQRAEAASAAAGRGVQGLAPPAEAEVASPRSFGSGYRSGSRTRSGSGSAQEVALSSSVAGSGGGAWAHAEGGGVAAGGSTHRGEWQRLSGGGGVASGGGGVASGGGPEQQRYDDSKEAPIDGFGLLGSLEPGSGLAPHKSDTARLLSANESHLDHGLGLHGNGGDSPAQLRAAWRSSSHHSRAPPAPAQPPPARGGQLLPPGGTSLSWQAGGGMAAGGGADTSPGGRTLGDPPLQDSLAGGQRPAQHAWPQDTPRQGLGDPGHALQGHGHAAGHLPGSAPSLHDQPGTAQPFPASQLSPASSPSVPLGEGLGWAASPGVPEGAGLGSGSAADAAHAAAAWPDAGAWEGGPAGSGGPGLDR